MSEIKKIAPRLPTQYLRDFFLEKDVPDELFEVEGESGVNFIPNACVVEAMIGISENDLEAVSDVLRRIDVVNGNVNHFLKHLAKGLAR